MTTHRLKTWPIQFQSLWDGIKTYDIRKNDRSFMIGDRLDLREWRPTEPFELTIEGYTGRQIVADVVYMTPGGTFGLPGEVCVLGIREVRKSEQAWDEIEIGRAE